MDWRGTHLLCHSPIALYPIRSRLVSTISSSEKRHIAVLPFDNIGNRPESEAISEGLMEQSLWIVPASVVRRLKVNDPATALRDLGATLVVKGSIQRADHAMHLTVNLIET